MAQDLRTRFAEQVRRGEPILFTGAGFSRAAKNRGGVEIPSTAELRELLWECAFPGEEFDNESTLGDLYDCASTQAGNRTKAALEAALRVDRGTLPEGYAVWLSMPWFRIYTLNVDDLVEVAARKFKLEREIVSISALQEGAMPEDELLCVHLNGRLADFPAMTFSQRQYGERTAGPDLWYQQFVRDYAAHPVVFVGTSLDEPPLWQHLELRGRRRAERRELRPGSYLVTRSLPAARNAILRAYNVDHVPMYQEDFATEVLAALSQEAAEGLRVRAGERRSGGERALLDVGELRRDVGGDPREFLWGREPIWRDLTDGYAIQRTFEGSLERSIAESGARVAVLTGTAGSGKSTTLMRLALQYHAEGRDVRWLNLASDLSVRSLRDAARVSGASVVIVDDADTFGESTGPLLSELASDNPDLLVAAAIRSTRYGHLAIETHLRDTPYFQLTVPNLDDDDIDLLLDALAAANRLGALTGKPRGEQVAAFQKRAGRQLIVALIEATFDERFDEKIQRECREVGPDAGAHTAWWRWQPTCGST